MKKYEKTRKKFDNKRYGNWMRNMSKLPYIVGAWMFQYMDQPAGGRGDGENSNYGIVNGTDDGTKEKRRERNNRPNTNFEKKKKSIFC